jgi:UDP-N-acetylmuramoylalanine--D-glutamate ligase
LLAAAAAGVSIWGEVELAWRLRADPAPPWLVITGTNGKTTAVRMLASMLTAAGLRAPAAGNVGTPLLEVVTAEPAPDVLAVELSSFQLHWSCSIAQSATVLNVAPDHLDWHGSIEDCSREANVSGQPDRLRLQRGRSGHRGLVRAAGWARLPSDRVRSVPAPGMVGIVGDYLVDRAFVAGKNHPNSSRRCRRGATAPHN